MKGMRIVDALIGTPFERLEPRKLELEKIRLKTKMDHITKSISKPQFIENIILFLIGLLEIRS
jgi:hypothetical protein